MRTRSLGSGPPLILHNPPSSFTLFVPSEIVFPNTATFEVLGAWGFVHPMTLPPQLHFLTSQSPLPLSSQIHWALSLSSLLAFAHTVTSIQNAGSQTWSHAGTTWGVIKKQNKKPPNVLPESHPKDGKSLGLRWGLCVERFWRSSGDSDVLGSMGPAHLAPSGPSVGSSLSKVAVSMAPQGGRTPPTPQGTGPPLCADNPIYSLVSLL